MTAIQPAASPDAWGVVSRLRRDDELVLATQVLKRGTDETTLSRFGDDRWNLAPAVFRENAPHALTAVNFATLDDPVQRLTAKEFIWARLNEPSPCPTRARMAPTVARATLTDLSGFMAFVARHAGTFTMHMVDQAILDAYLAELRRERGRTAERQASAFRRRLRQNAGLLRRATGIERGTMSYGTLERTGSEKTRLQEIREYSGLEVRPRKPWWLLLVFAIVGFSISVSFGFSPIAESRSIDEHPLATLTMTSNVPVRTKRLPLNLDINVYSV